MSSPNASSAGAAASSSASGGGASGGTGSGSNSNNKQNSKSTIAKEVSHYVVTAHPPGGVLFTCKGHFVASHDAKTSQDVIVAKSRRLELRTWQSSSSSSSSATNNADGDGTNANATESTNNNSDNNKTSLFPVVATTPIHGRLTCLQTIQLKKSNIDFVFLTTDRHQYAVLSYEPSMRPYPFRTHASGRLPSGEDPSLLGRKSESGPLVAVDPQYRCIALHWLDGLITIIPIDQNYNPPPPVNATTAAAGSTTATTASGTDTDMPTYWPKAAAASNSGGNKSCLKEPFHVRMEERTLLNMVFLETTSNSNTGSGNLKTDEPEVQIPPQLTLLHQDSRGTQHVYTHSVDLRKHSFTQGNLKRSRVDGGSSWMIPVPASKPIIQQQQQQGDAKAAAAAATGSAAAGGGPPQTITLGGVIVLGQRQITYANATTTKVTPVPPCLFLSWDALPDDPKGMPRYLLADEFGNLHLLSFLTYHARIVALTLETLGSCGLCHTLQYIGDGLTFVGSTLGDSQLVQIHEEPIRNADGGNANNNNNNNANNNNSSAAVATGMGGSGSNHNAMEDDPSVANTEDATAVAGNSNNNNSQSDMDWMVDSTYLTVVEEYTHLGPIVDFDLVPTAPGLASSTSNQPSQVVTASGTSRAGSIRLIRNGIGMNEYASVEMPGIQAMWSVRENYASPQDAYLVQSFVGQTRVLGVTTLEEEEEGEEGDGGDKTMENESQDEDDEEEAGGTLEEVELPGLDANATSLYVGNVQAGDGLLQITKAEIRLISLPKKEEGGGGGMVLDTWSPPDTAGTITVAAGNEAGQAVVATPGGTLWYLAVNEDGTKLESLHQKQMDREVSCLDVHPFAAGNNKSGDMMDTSSSEQPRQRLPAKKSTVVAVGLWDDFTVRLLALNNELNELHQIHLSTDDEEEEEEDPSAMMSAEESAMARRHRNNMMARSLCLITLDVSNSSSSSSHHHSGGGGNSSSHGSTQGVDMLFVGLGDGTVVSFAVVMAENEKVSVQSKKEVCLGTQRINLIPLQTEWGGTCVLATGDRPTVIYLAGVGSGATSGGNPGAAATFNPKLCYSNVNLQVSEEEEAENVSRSASQQTIAVNVAAPFFSSLLFDAGSLGSQYYSLCVADDANLRLGVIDDIQKLHVTTCRLGMAPRRIVHCPDARMFAVGCIESGIKQLGLGGEEHNMGNCVRFLDDTTFDDIERIDLEPYEMILSMTYASLRVHSPTSSTATTTDGEGGVNAGDPTGDGSGASNFRTYLLVGTAYALPDEDEPTRGRIMVMSCGGSGMEEEAATSNNARAIRQVTELQVRGAVYSMSQFFDGKVLAAVNSKTQILQLTDDVNAGGMKLNFVGVGHHGHILSLFVKSQAGRQASLAASPTDAGEQKGPAAAGAVPMDVDNPHKKKKPAPATEQEMLAIVGDLMRSISVVQYYPQHDTLEEIARDFNTNWTTAIEMLNDDVYLGAENWNNLFVLRRNTKSQSEEIRCRLDTIGEFHLGEMVNKFMKGSLVMPHSSNSASNTRKSSRRGSVSSPTKKKSADGTSPSKGGQGAAVRIRRPPVVIGSQTLFGTVEGTLGCILGLDVRTAAFFACIERAMTKVIRPVGDFSHQKFRAFDAERRIHPHHGFVDGDLVESFLDLDRATMEAVVREMNRDGGWEVDRGTMSPSSTREGGSGGDKGDANPEVDPVDHPELVVEDVVAMVEEMAMLH